MDTEWPVSDETKAKTATIWKGRKMLVKIKVQRVHRIRIETDDVGYTQNESKFCLTSPLWSS